MSLDYKKIRQGFASVVKVNLLDHQIDGVIWMRNMENSAFMGGVLADDMGLGKTLQMLVTMVLNGYHQTLVVCPLAVVQNWKREIKDRLDLPIKIAIYRGKSRHVMDLADYNIVITTYATLSLEPMDGQLMTNDWHRVVLDESQMIKNHETKCARAVCNLEATYRWCLSGTPVQNNLDELFSTTKFLRIPNYSTKSDFDDSMEISSANELMKQISLRRTKDILSLPRKRVHEYPCHMVKEETNVYNAYMAQVRRLCFMQRKAEEENSLEEDTRPPSMASILAKLTKLRQGCNHVKHLYGEKDHVPDWVSTHTSSKQEAIVKLVKKLVARKRQVIVFSYFLSMVNNLVQDLETSSHTVKKYTGAMVHKKREQVLEEFRNGNIQVLVMSTTCANVGINLTQASAVVLVEPWWNPFVDDQAMDRAHRIGQIRNVDVFKCFVPNTIDDRIMILQKVKRELVEDLWADPTTTTTKKKQVGLTKKDITFLLR